MDGSRFDDLARLLAKRDNRRRIVRTFAVSAFGAAGLGRFVAAANDDDENEDEDDKGGRRDDRSRGHDTCVRSGKKCQKHKECCSGHCCNGTCRDCCADADCPAPADRCKKAVCSRRGQCLAVDAVTCTASDDCHDPGTCDPATGACTNPTVGDGAPCGEDNACIDGATCLAGVCQGGTRRECTSDNPCMVANCDPAQGCVLTPKDAGTKCGDGDVCIGDDRCDGNGNCEPGTAVICVPCQRCNTETGACEMDPDQDDQACPGDGNMCFREFRCRDGDCVGIDEKQCTPLDACHDVGTCQPDSGECTNPSKPDDTACPAGPHQSASCRDGECKVVCDAGFADCDGNPDNGCEIAILTDPLNCGGCAPHDGKVCTANASCVNGACVCTGGPAALCGDGSCCPAGEICGPGDVCSPPLARGEVCEEHQDCAAGFCCPAGTVREGVCGIRNNEVCDSNGDCCSGICVRNICRAAPGQTGAACDGGDTADCAAGLACCGDPASQTGFSCTDVNVDRANCGACVADGGTVCPAGETCTGGVCTGNADAVCLALPDICANTTAPCDPSAGGTCYCTTTIEGHTRCASVVGRGNCSDARCTSSSECPGKPRPGNSEVYGPEAFCGRVDGCCGQGTGLCFEPCWTQREGETCAAGIECESGTCCGAAGEMICCGFGGATGESESCFAGACCPADQICEGNTICCACPNACVGDTCLDAGPQLPGELTSQSSTFDRCDGSGTGFFYDTYIYHHDDGWLAINLRGTAAGGGTLRDSYIYLYRGFDPADPCSNRVAEDDDSGCGFESRIVGNFPADRYEVVVTTYDPGDTGTYTLEFNRCLECPA